jgi:nitrate/nitrite transporter NarK
MRDLIRSEAMIALPMMFTAQAVITMAAFAVPVAAPAAAPAIGIPTLYVGAYTAIVYCLGMTTGLFAGGLIRKFGTIRTIQGLLLLIALGIAIFDLATPLAAIIGAIMIGIATGPMNPAGSHILARTSPPRWRAFVFSIKQCGTPMGGMLAGVVVPPLLLLYGWQIALSVVSIAALVILAVVQIARRRIDADRQPNTPLAATDIATPLRPLRMILTDRPLRAVAIAGFAYGGAQVTLAAYLVVYMTERHGMDLTTAGFLYALFSGAGIPSRIVWGMLADRVISTASIIVLMGLIMPAGFVLVGQFDADWPLVAMAFVAVLLGATANGWVGLFFAEVVRLAPDGTASEASGGAQFFAYGGIMVTPLAFGATVGATGSYPLAFNALAVLTTAAVLNLLRVRLTGGGGSTGA